MPHRNIFVGVAAAILFYQLILPPVVGLADNGDFIKIIARFDLYARVHRTYQFCDTTYDFRPERHWVGEFYSSEILLVLPALLLNSLLSKTGSFDLRCIGVVHAALFLIALWMFAPLLADARRGTRISIYALVLFAFCDVMYVSGLNSFYMDEPAYLFLLLSSVLYLRVIRWHRRRDALLLLICVLLLATAKIQHAPLGIVFAVLMFATRRMLWPTRDRVVAAGAACIVFASLLIIWKGVPRDYAGAALYNVVFLQLLPHSKNVERTLSDLGLDDSYRPLIGKNAFYPDSRMDDPVFQAAFNKRVSLPRLAAFYVTHPRDTYEALRDSLGEAGRQQLSGNFDISVGYPPLTESQAFAFWSGFKRRLFFHHGSRLLFAFLAVAAALSALLWVNRKTFSPGAVPAGFALLAMALTGLMIASLLDKADIARHHSIFFVLFDMMIITTVYIGLHAGRGFREQARQSRRLAAEEVADVL